MRTWHLVSRVLNSFQAFQRGTNGREHMLGHVWMLWGAAAHNISSFSRQCDVKAAYALLAVSIQSILY
jgi:hypothetical protein